MKKKLISLLLIVVLLLNSLPLAVFAADDFEWELTDAGTLILTGSGPMPDYTSASRAPWYKDRTKIKAVSMDSRFTTIGDNAFFGCWYLETITLPQQLTRIGADAFSDCEQLESITLPDGITEIGARAFSDCVKLNRLVLPQELQGVYSSESGFAFVYRDLDGKGQYNIHIYNEEGEQEQE